MREFPETFDPGALIGARGRQFLRREDAFQQLVGDGLRELRGGLGIHVAPTRGQDGSIDIFIEPLASGDDRCFSVLPKPLIVECKDVDEGGKDLRANLFAGWRRVARKLERQAVQGWSGNFAPWRSARAYVYAVSARLPSQHLRLGLRDKITRFFATLPGAQMLEAIEVLDWSDLRAMWKTVPRLADGWLGVGLETILGHADQIARFTGGFRSYLLEENLPFLPASADDPTDPDTLLASLGENDRDRGLLIEGPGGVGKSRILVEVARRAHTAGWRVLHAQAGEPALTDIDLEATVLKGSGQTLLVLDYFDQMKLDLERLRLRLLPAASARGIRLAVLANARPSLDRPMREEFFDVVAMRPTQNRVRAIADRLLQTVAPHALKRLGYDRLADLCGVRPIVALFIAREVDRRSAAGTLDEKRLSGVRSGHLTKWLRDRLKEGGLSVPRPGSPLEPATPSPHLVAAAAILAAAPQPEAALVAVGKRTLETAGLDARFDANDRGHRLVALLREMGWLETRGHELATAHDVVADEVVHDVLADRDAATVRTVELEALLAPALDSARTLGRLAVALRRVLGMEGVADEVSKNLADASATWLARGRWPIGRLLQLADPDEVAFALADVVTGQPWGNAALESWDQLFAPFLDVHAEHASTRHLLYRGLSALPKGRGALLLPVAGRWLGRHGLLPEASFVVAPLLKREDLVHTEAVVAVKAGVAWFLANPLHPQADFVIRGLLRRTELEINQRQQVMILAVRWLRHTPAREDRDFALSSMLWNAELLDEQARDFLINDILDWLLLAARSEDTVRRLETGIRRLAQQHSTEAWVTSSKRLAASHFTQLVHDLKRHALDPSEPLTKGRLEAAMSHVDTVLAGEEPPAAGYILTSLLPLAARDGDPTCSDRVRGQVERLLTHPRTSHRNRAGFAKACFDLLDAGAWPSSEAGEELLAELHIERPAGGQPEHKELRRELADYLDSGKLPTAELLERAVKEAARALDGARTASVGYLLGPLLPLAARIEDPEFRYAVHALIRRFLSDSELTAKTRLGFAGSCYRHLDNGAWPSRATAERELEELGVQRPEPGAVAQLGFFQVTRGFAELLATAGAVPTEKQLNDGMRLAAEVLDGSHETSAGFLLTCLLPLAARHGQHQLERVCKLVTRFLTSPTLTVRNRTGFADACHRYLDEGAWPDRQTGERVLAELGIAPSDFLALSRELADCIRTHDKIPSRDLLERAIEQTKRTLESDLPASAGYLLVSLLPLVARVDNIGVVDHVHQLTRRLESLQTLSPQHRLGFAAACYRNLDDGAWPDRRAGESVLAHLGIDKPKSHRQTHLSPLDLRDLERQAMQLAASTGPLPSPDWLEMALAQTAKPIQNGRPKVSGFVFPPLLALAARFGSPATHAELARQIKSLLDHPSLSPRGRQRFSRACYQLVDNGVWPDRSKATDVLLALGIKRATEAEGGSPSDEQPARTMLESGID